MLAVGAIALLAGLLAGLTGIGGVILVPALTELAKIPINVAIGTTMFALIFAGSLAAYANLRRIKLRLVPVVALGLAAAIGAMVGTITLDWMSASLVKLFVAVVAAASGLYTLRDPARLAVAAYEPSNSVLVVLGFVVGWGSAVSGTGGPIMLIPILLTLRTGSAAAVGFGLAAHLPIIVTASAINHAAGRIDYPLAALLAGPMVIGTLGGMYLFSRLSSRALTISVGLVLIVVGIWYAYATLRYSVA